MDSELCRDDPGASEEIFDSWSARISPGLNDAAGKHNANQIPWKTTNLQNELRGALEVASLEHACRKFHNLCSHSDEQLMKYANKLMSKSCAAPSCSDQDDMSDMKVTDSRISWKCRDEMAAASTNALNALDGDSCLQVTTLSENLARYEVGFGGKFGERCIIAAKEREGRLKREGEREGREWGEGSWREGEREGRKRGRGKKEREGEGGRERGRWSEESGREGEREKRKGEKWKK